MRDPYRPTDNNFVTYSTCILNIKLLQSINIQRVTSLKALGITITSQLSMNLHVDTLPESCS